MPEVQLDASHIMDVGMGFWPSKTLLSAWAWTCSATLAESR